MSLRTAATEAERRRRTQVLCAYLGNGIEIVVVEQAVEPCSPGRRVIPVATAKALGVEVDHVCFGAGRGLNVCFFEKILACWDKVEMWSHTVCIGT